MTAQEPAGALVRLLSLLAMLLSAGCGGGAPQAEGSRVSGEAEKTPFLTNPVTVVEQIQLAYNEERYDKIHQLFNSELARRNPLEKNRQTLSKIRSVCGRWTRTESLKVFKGCAAIFEARFEEGQWGFSLILDTDGRIEHLSIFLPRTLLGLPISERNSVRLSLPVRGIWVVEAGGAEDFNSLYHLLRPDSHRALDFLIRDESGRAYLGQGRRNEDYHAWGQEVFSPGDGVVVKVVQDIADNEPGRRHPTSSGNGVWIRHSEHEVSLLLHLMERSVFVKEGSRVKRGDPIARCGNSGNSDQPHLHYQLMNSEEEGVATGIKVFFERIKRIRSGESQILQDYSPVTGDQVSDSP